MLNIIFNINVTIIIILYYMNEKLIKRVYVRLTEEQRKELSTCVSKYNRVVKNKRVSISEYIRNLILQDIEKQQEKIK